MPTDDTRLAQVLHDAAPVVDASGVLDRVASKRVRRRRQRRLATGASALVVVLLVIVVTVLVTRDDTRSPQVAAPGAGLSARVVTGRDATADGQEATPEPVALDADPGVLVAPVTVSSTAVSTASHDRGPDGLPLTHVVRIDGTHVIDVVNFKAEVVSIADGEGARWALTRNPRPTGGTLPDTFLKRIGAVGDPVSTQLPLDADPVGPVAAVGGAVWVPLRDGVLQFDPATAALAREIPLPAASSRYVAQVGKGRLRDRPRHAPPPRPRRRTRQHHRVRAAESSASPPPGSRAGSCCPRRAAAPMEPWSRTRSRPIPCA